MPKRSYHHGDLRRVVLAAAVDLILEQGIEAVTLRELARRTGVSHAAPAHHFHDKQGLFTAIAAEGHHLLADALIEGAEEPAAPLMEQGVRYVAFAERHPAHFEVMFRPDLLDRHDADLLIAQTRARQALRGGVEELAPSRRPAGVDEAALAAWALAHGFAALRRSGSLERILQGRETAEAFRSVAGHLFMPALRHDTDHSPTRGRPRPEV